MNLQLKALCLINAHLMSSNLSALANQNAHHKAVALERDLTCFIMGNVSVEVSD